MVEVLSSNSNCPSSALFASSSPNNVNCFTSNQIDYHHHQHNHHHFQNHLNNSNSNNQLIVSSDNQQQSVHSYIQITSRVQSSGSSTSSSASSCLTIDSGYQQSVNCLPDSTCSEYSTSLQSSIDYNQHNESTTSSCASLIETTTTTTLDQSDESNQSSINYEPSSKLFKSSSLTNQSNNHQRFRRKRGVHHQIQQRQAANLRERRRMQSINDAFEVINSNLIDQNNRL